jgi:TPP-dependent pyruvate/acetoin dehydrogenase alpha subunit
MVGIGAATTDKDSIITSYRDHCTHLVKGGTLLEVRPQQCPAVPPALCCSRGTGRPV